jgi:proteic killer suppression protein
MLDALDAAAAPDELNLPGYRFHELKGDRAGTYSLAATGNVRVTFAFEGEDAVQVNLEDYH